LLGLLIESVTGESYETYLDREFLKPLGMEDSSFTFTTQEGENADSRLAWGHIDDGSRYAAVPIMLRPAGQFTTTSQDWMKFALFLMSDGEINGRVFIEPELMAARGVATTTLAAKAGLEVGYAMGLSRLDRYGSIGLCHSGNIIGFMALMCIYPQSHQAFTVSVNTDNETASYRRLYDVIASALDHPMQAKPVRATPADDSLDWQGYYILAPNRFESFRYLDLVFGFSRFYWEADDLIFDPFQGATRMLVPVGGYILAATDRQQESHVLMKSEEGIPLISDGYRTYQQISPLMLIFLWSSLSLGMLALLWFFVAGLLEIKRQKLNAFKRPAGIGFLAVIALLVPVPLFFLQPFMALGDFTLASFALATATSLLPICMLISLGLGMRGDSRSRINWLHAIAALAVLQWCAVLFYFGLLPLKLWT